MKQDVEKKIQQLVKELQQLFENRLVSVCVYGSAVFQEELPPVKEKYRNINVLVILEQMELSDLERASSAGKWWEKEGHSLPMFLSEEEWLRSGDVFALEYADIRDNHYLAYGKDLFSGIQVDKEALRLVCELELHRKLVFLRQRLLLHRDQPHILLEMLQEHINSFTALFRGVLRLGLDEGKVPQKASLVFEGMKNLVKDYDPTPLLRVLQSKEPNTQVRHTDIFSLFCQCIRQIGLVTAYVDNCFGFVTHKEGV